MTMGGGKQIIVKETAIKDGGDTHQDQWVSMEAGNANCDSDSIESTYEDSTDISVSSSSEMVEEDADDGSSSTSSSSPSFGPLFELSDLLTQLPIKRGLSKYYEGKSQSFASLGSVKSLEDLAKKESPYRRKMKACKSYGGGLDGHGFSPKATITKKNSRGRGAFLSSLLGKRSSSKSSFHIQVEL